MVKSLREAVIGANLKSAEIILENIVGLDRALPCANFPPIQDLLIIFYLLNRGRFYDPKLRDFIETVRKAHDQIIDNVNLGAVNVAAWDADFGKKADEDIASFRKFMEDTLTPPD